MSEYKIPESESPTSGRRQRVESQELNGDDTMVNIYRQEASVEEDGMTNLVIQKPTINRAAHSSLPTSDQQPTNRSGDFEDVLKSLEMGSETTLTKSHQEIESNENNNSPAYSEPSMEASVFPLNPLASEKIDDSQPEPRPHGSSSDSVSSSAIVTPQQQHTERFGSVSEIQRGSGDSGVDVERSDFKIARSFITKQQLSTKQPATVVLMDEVRPLNTGSSISAPTDVQPAAAPIEHTHNLPEGTDMSPTSSEGSPVQKSKLSLLPSAFGFAASLLPLARTESASSTASSATDKSSSSAGTQERSSTSPTNNVRHRRGSSDASETSSIISTSSSKGIVDSIPALGSLGPSSWRSLTTFLTSRAPVAPIQESPLTPTPGKNQRAAARDILQVGEETPSTSFLLHHVTSASATADRRRSLELGGPQMLREGFERVKAEMASSAKELREKERQKRDSARSEATLGTSNAEDVDEAGRSTAAQAGSKEEGTSDRHSLGSDGIDWSFWGSVMSDYELVARTRPKALSRAIQEGVPAVVRGTIWQLMSASKSITLEATYSALLKLPSPHEKAIQKDLSRTFPNHAYFKKGNGVGQENLFNVVKAYMFAEGLEAIFRFSMALMRKNEVELLRLDFEGILRFLTIDIFECYKNTASKVVDEDAESVAEPASETEWLTNEFVRDAYAVQFTPFMLDSFAGEWEEHLRTQNAHAMELDTLRNANRSLRDQVNNEHVEIVKQLVQSRIEKEELENELIRYKVM
ncbi:hypothetical protein QFC22_003792 [Naganishia vaughanmartiniae]|uniref:Uncharacterized protein n=1 Tax=Naganishia vaughanmartiniae TaxID=1424756 RepID=A0ACC2X5K1_9TREE|nr:hypothetical protein QFC22_003792 [Naganishia vaughanmartiniae]